MKIFSSFNEIASKAKLTIIKYPISLIWAIIGTFFTIWFIDQKINHEIEFKYIKIILTFILGVSWLIASRLLINYFKEEKQVNKSWIIILPLIFLGVYYFTLPNDIESFNNNVVTPYRFALFLITGHLFLFFSPFIFNWDKKAYWNYLKSIFTAFATSTIFSLVLYFGLTIALMALKYLFHFEIKGDRYFELFVFCLGIINTWIFLADLPDNIHQQKNIEYPNPLLVFVKYILVPLTVLYLVILYTYSFKILINWSLPKGWVSYLVIALSILGFIIHIFINPIRKTSKSRLIKNFYPWFYYALIPMIALLFTAIFKRISEYGFTENRYLVLLLSFWILGMTLYILISKRKMLRYFPMSVALLALIVSFGFWGMFSVSKNSQIKAFKELYVSMKNNNFNVKYSEKNRFESITQYLTDHNSLSKIDDVIGFKTDVVYKDKNKWEIVRKLTDTLNLKVTDLDKDKRLGYYFITKTPNKSINIKGYDYLKQLYFNDYPIPTQSKYNPKNEINQYQFKLDTISHTKINITKGNEHLTIDLNPLINALKNENSNNEVSQDKLTIEQEFKTLKLKLIFNNLELRNKDEDGQTITPNIAHATAFALIKEKNAPQ